MKLYKMGIVLLSSDTTESKLKLEKLSTVGPVITSDVDESISIISLCTSLGCTRRSFRARFSALTSSNSLTMSCMVGVNLIPIMIVE